MVAQPRIELGVCRVWTEYFSQLNYWALVAKGGFEPPTFSLWGWRADLCSTPHYLAAIFHRSEECAITPCASKPFWVFTILCSARAFSCIRRLYLVLIITNQPYRSWASEEHARQSLAKRQDLGYLIPNCDLQSKEVSLTLYNYYIINSVKNQIFKLTPLYHSTWS